jgi:hypothetical protein
MPLSDKKIVEGRLRKMGYGTSAHNRPVYAQTRFAGLTPLKRPCLHSPKSVAMLFPTAHLGGAKPYGFFYSAARISQNSRKLYET